jgi:hypothetical protein
VRYWLIVWATAWTLLGFGFGALYEQDRCAKARAAQPAPR